jgi:hypothetical protein
MALGAVTAAALTDHSAHPAALWVGGVDVIEDPARRYAVPIETLHVQEMGPGSVSRMTFTVEDYSLAAVIQTGAEVRFYNITNDFAVFTGLVDSVSLQPAFGDTGRSFDVEAVGVEAYLDWAITTADISFVSPGVLALADMVLSVFAQSSGTGPLRASVDKTSPTNGSQSGPVSVTGSMGATPLVPLTIPAGTTLRESIRLIAATVYSTPAFDSNGVAWATVDFNYGLRVWTPTPGTPPPVEGPTDYGALTIVDTGASADVAELLEYAIADPLIAGILVVGNATSSLVTNSTPGQIAYLSDSTLTTTAGCTAAGYAYLKAQAPTLRASYRRTDYAVQPTIHAMSFVTITDARLALSAVGYMILSIEKTFNDSGRENWIISFGGLAPRASSLIRRWTRTIRS